MTFWTWSKKDALTCHGQATVGRAQIPKADQPLRCAIAVYSQIIGKQQRYKPTWEMSAVWHEKEWILSMQAAPHHQTRLTIYVPEPLHDIFQEQFGQTWQQWGQQKGSNRRTDGYKPQDFYQITVKPFTPDKVTELNAQYAELQAQRAPPSSMRTPPCRTRKKLN